MKNRRIWAMGIGFALDVLLGDPEGWPHPIRLIGNQIAAEEDFARNNLIPAAARAAEEGTWPFDAAETERLAGGAVVLSVATLAPLATWVLVRSCGKASEVLGLVVESIVCYQMLATRSLVEESMAVKDALDSGTLDDARRQVGRIVGRDTDSLDEEGIARATVETVAENASDGVVAPLLYMALGGAPAAVMYKAVNTLDSMLGYKSERYMNFGRVAARLDDVFNIVPARVSGALMCVGAKIAGFDAQRAWEIFKRDRLNHSSPNSAHTEAACAGALGVQLGGANYYFGELVEKPTIGDATRPVESADIARANKLLGATALLALGCSALVALLARRF